MRRSCEHLENRILLSSWYVSTGVGSDAAPGTLAQPFKTIQEAANAAQPGDTVFIRGGMYRETVVPPRSGNSGQPITFEPYRGEQVVIDGADPINNWSQYQGSIYQASVPWNLLDGTNQLFFDGQMMTEARWPNTSLDVSHPTFATTSWANAQVNPVGLSTATIGVPLNDPAGTWVGATIHISPGPGWIVQTGTVIASSPGTLTYQYQPATADEVPTGGNKFYLSGLFRTLDSSAEWYLDNSGKLSFWASQNANPAGHDVELKHRQYAFDLSGRSNIDVAGIQIFGCTINTDARSTNNLIDGITARYVSQQWINAVPWNAQYHPHTSGIILNGAYNTIQNSAIDFSSGDGVFLGGSNNTVQNCVISNVDYAGGDEAGVSTLGSNEHVAGNTIYNAARSGVVIRFSPFDQVLHNVVHDVGLQLTDLGGIYTWGTDGHGSEIAYNQVYNIHTGGYGAAGVYLDNNAANYVVDHNVVWNCDFGLKLNPPSNENVIYNNTFVGTQYGLASSGNEDMSGTELANNIFGGPVQIGPGAQQTHNLFTPPSAQFVNPGAGNFQLQANSPAIDAGTALPPYNIPTAGNAPDIGAYEYGLAPFGAGAGIGPASESGNPLSVPTLPIVTPPPTGSGSASGQQTGSTSTGSGGTTSGTGSTGQQTGSGSSSGTGSSQGDPKEKPPTTVPTPTPPVQSPPPTNSQPGSGSSQSGSGPTNPAGSGSGASASGSGSASSTGTPAPAGEAGSPSPAPVASVGTPAPAATSVLLISSENPALSGDGLQFTAHVLAPVTPSGCVSFYDGSVLLGTLTLGPTGSVSLPFSATVVGTHTITAAFQPDASQTSLAASTSAALVETITAIQPGTPNVTAAVLSQPARTKSTGGQFGQPTNTRVNVRLTNTGSGIANGPVKIDLYLSSDEGLDSGDVFVASLSQNLRLRPNQSRTVSVPLRRYPSSTPSGTTAQPDTYYLLAQISGLQSPTRLISSAAAVKVASSQPQLAMAFDGAVSSDLRPGARGHVSVIIENSGRSRVRGMLPVILSIGPAANTSPSSSMPLLKTTRHVNIAPGKRTKLTLKYVLPSNLGAGSYAFTVQASASSNLSLGSSRSPMAISDTITVAG